MFTLLSFCESSAEILQLVGKIINIIKIVIPIIIVVLAMLDLGKAVMAGEEKQIKEAQSNAVKRIIVGIIIMFVPTIVNLILDLMGKGLDTCGIK